MLGPPHRLPQVIRSIMGRHELLESVGHLRRKADHRDAEFGANQSSRIGVVQFYAKRRQSAQFAVATEEECGPQAAQSLRPPLYTHAVDDSR